MVITIIVYHPLDVPLGPTHLLLRYSCLFSFEPPLQAKARTEPMYFSFKCDCIHHLPTTLASLVFLHCCSKIGKEAQGLVPPLFGTMGGTALPLLPKLVPETFECQSALRSLLSFLFCLLTHD
jgi:hypothetical protein